MLSFPQTIIHALHTCMYHIASIDLQCVMHCLIMLFEMNFGKQAISLGCGNLLRLIRANVTRSNHQEMSFVPPRCFGRKCTCVSIYLSGFKTLQPYERHVFRDSFVLKEQTVCPLLLHVSLHVRVKTSKYSKHGGRLRE